MLFAGFASAQMAQYAQLLVCNAQCGTTAEECFVTRGSFCDVAKIICEKNCRTTYAS
jgi:hypothetical protein